MKVGVIGVGAITTPLISSLIEDKHEVIVWNRTRSKAEPLEQLGAKIVDSAAETSAGGTVISCLADDKALDAVFNDQRVFQALGEDGLHISMTTCTPQASHSMAMAVDQNGGRHLTAAVLGRPDFVAKRAHRHLCSGNRSAFEIAQPLLESISAGVFFLGENPTTASVAKICTNYLIASSVANMGEALGLAEALGCDGAALREVWINTLFSGVVHTNYSEQILARDFEPLFKLRLMLKDTQLFTDAAKGVALNTPLAEALESCFIKGVESGLSEKDFTAISELVRTTPTS